MNRFTLVLATHNPHKVRELKEMLKEYPFLDVRSLRDFPSYSPLPEVGATFEENAAAKGAHAALALGEWVLADDSGLVVPALHGAPGIHSARYAGEGATDTDNRRRLLKEMQGLEEAMRVATFECALTLAGPGGEGKTVMGSCEGVILEKERGRHGFGYDPLFMKFEYRKTFAEMDEALKNRISHRRKAFDRLAPHLAALCAT